MLSQFPIPLFSLFSKFLLNLVLIAFQRRITLRNNEVYEDDNFLLLLPLHKKISECVVYHIKYSSGIGNFWDNCAFFVKDVYKQNYNYACPKIQSALL